jgi:hypothetical protein
MLGSHQGPVGLRTRVAELARQPGSKALLIGAAAVVATPIVLPLLKPILKATLKSGVILYEKAKIAIAETGEVLADVAAEARAEVLAEAQKKASLPAAAAAEGNTAE